MASLLGPGGKPPHIAMVARPDEMDETFPRLRAEACLAETDRIETDPQRLVPDLAAWVRRAPFVRGGAKRRSRRHGGQTASFRTYNPHLERNRCAATPAVIASSVPAGGRPALDANPGTPPAVIARSRARW
jgi:hypothetical protein